MLYSYSTFKLCKSIDVCPEMPLIRCTCISIKVAKCHLGMIFPMNHHHHHTIITSGFIPVNGGGQIYPTLAAIFLTPTLHLAFFSLFLHSPLLKRPSNSTSLQVFIQIIYTLCQGFHYFFIFVTTLPYLFPSRG